jgi:hypothetical protein
MRTAALASSKSKHCRIKTFAVTSFLTQGQSSTDVHCLESSRRWWPWPSCLLQKSVSINIFKFKMDCETLNLHLDQKLCCSSYLMKLSKRRAVPNIASQRRGPGRAGCPRRCAQRPRLLRDNMDWSK